MKKAEVKVGDRIVEGEIVDFDTVKEDWSIYKLADGSTIRIKIVATRFIKTNEFSPTGEPLYHLQSMGPIIVADVPEELKKSPRKESCWLFRNSQLDYQESWT